ncbi:MAG: hypothetical protein C5B54_01015 [Acidobacteria bacterium]|nr:MAG: hypothetical protein C5B54_01015 [Acidobacteriota bacterium]
MNRRFLQFVALCLIIVVGFAFRITKINAVLPYVAAVDEPILTESASQIIRSGNLNPHFFNYPSLPVYITVVGFTVGFLWSASKMEVKTTHDMGTFDYPYYSQQRIVFVAKFLFTLFSLVTLFLIGLIASKAFRDPDLLWIAPMVLSFSGLFFLHSAGYLNVDIIGVSFSVITVLYCIYSFSRTPTFANRVLIPGIYAGLAVASKYNMVPIVIPVMLLILFSEKKDVDNLHPGRTSWKLKYLLLFPLVSIATFLIVVPFSYLDFPAFLNGVAHELYHYQSGHEGFTGTPGFPEFLFFCSKIADEYGYTAAIIGVLGIGFALKRDSRLAWLVVSYPAGLLILMSLQAVNFIRNILGTIVFFSIFIAIGVVNLRRILARRMPAWVASLILIVVLTAGISWRNLANAFYLTPDSRTLAMSWLLKNAPKGTTIFVPDELGMDSRKLDSDYHVITESVTDPQNENERTADFMIVPRFGSGGANLGQKWMRIMTRLNEQYDGCQQTVQFGSQAVVLNSAEHSFPASDPLFRIAKK